MPIGVIINTLSIFLGGLWGVVVGKALKPELKEKLNMIFGLSSIAMGITTIVLMENMPAVILAVISGTLAGLCLHLGERINQASGIMQRMAFRLMKSSDCGLQKEEQESLLLTIIVLFCASSTGFYGSVISGMTGDHTILIAKSILDLFTAMIFACSLGAVISMIAVPQFIIYMTLFICAQWILPHTTPAMINDFKAAGGFIMVATGFRMLNLTMFPTADMIPTMVLIMPMSWAWSSFAAPLLG